MIAWSWAAFAAPETVEICLTHRIDFVDDFGDYWADNTDRLARKVLVAVEDEVSTQVAHLGLDGCTTLSLELSAQGTIQRLEADSAALWLGRYVFAYQESEFNDNPDPLDPNSVDLLPEADDRSPASVVWLNVAVVNGEVSRRLPLNIRWQGLAIAGWMLHRSGFHFNQLPGRACCLEGDADYDPDGTCAGGAADPDNDYNLDEEPFELYFAHPDETGCPGGGGNNFGHSAGIQYNTTCPNKSLVSHELGHALVSARMAPQAFGIERYQPDAPLDDCMGDYWSVGNPVDEAVPAGRADHSKEYLSQAIREGWAEFVVMWTWNRRGDGDCVYRARGFSSDFDLDGALDNAASQDIDCAGSPWVGADPASPATDGINWLSDLIAANDAAGCAASADDVNRGAVMDVARFFWTLYADPGIQMDPTDLSDLYVDTCPLGWSEDDDEWKATGGLDTRPDRRIEAAAAEQLTFEADILTTWGDYVAQ